MAAQRESGSYKVHHRSIKPGAGAAFSKNLAVSQLAETATARSHSNGSPSAVKAISWVLQLQFCYLGPIADVSWDTSLS
jgi:hypothetical protein